MAFSFCFVVYFVSFIITAAQTTRPVNSSSKCAEAHVLTCTCSLMDQVRPTKHLVTRNKIVLDSVRRMYSLFSAVVVVAACLLDTLDVVGAIN